MSRPLQIWILGWVTPGDQPLVTIGVPTFTDDSTPRKRRRFITHMIYFAKDGVQWQNIIYFLGAIYCKSGHICWPKATSGRIWCSVGPDLATYRAVNCRQKLAYIYPPTGETSPVKISVGPCGHRFRAQSVWDDQGAMPAKQGKKAQHPCRKRPGENTLKKL